MLGGLAVLVLLVFAVMRCRTPSADSSEASEESEQGPPEIEPFMSQAMPFPAPGTKGIPTDFPLSSKLNERLLGLRNSQALPAVPSSSGPGSSVASVRDTNTPVTDTLEARTGLNTSGSGDVAGLRMEVENLRRAMVALQSGQIEAPPEYRSEVN